MKRVLLQPAYVLHRRAYRETSFIIELFTKEFGRLSVIAKGARKTRSSTAGLLLPFIPLIVSWAGKNELMTLTQVEANHEIKPLRGNCLFSGLYINELVMSLLQKWDAYPELYTSYEKTIAALQGNQLEESVLRAFEKKLLEELGYGLLPNRLSHHPFSADKYYNFTQDQGFVECGKSDEGQQNQFSGKSLLAIAEENWQDQSCLQDAKRLTRLILTPLLQGRTLYSRKLFMA